MYICSCITHPRPISPNSSPAILPSNLCPYKHRLPSLLTPHHRHHSPLRPAHSNHKTHTPSRTILPPPRTPTIPPPPPCTGPLNAGGTRAEAAWRPPECVADVVVGGGPGGGVGGLFSGGGGEGRKGGGAGC